MNFADSFVRFLADQYHVTDAFGIPGGVILRFLEALDKNQNIKAHLLYHESSAGFAACGYAQASGNLSLAYATRGPGIMNMMTCIAEAYQESLSVLFVTSHTHSNSRSIRVEYDQELDVVEAVKGFTKYAAKIETVAEAYEVIEKACCLAVSGRKGPVLLDILSTLWNQEIEQEKWVHCAENNLEEENRDKVVDTLVEALGKAERPILLIGDGIRQGNVKDKCNEFALTLGIPVLSSRGAQGICKTDNYFGYIGSHGLRYSNFILAKADLMIVIGNRLAFPKNSRSFRPIIDCAKVIRIDIDCNEFEKELSTVSNFCLDAGVFFKLMEGKRINRDFSLWLDLCKEIKKTLKNHDISAPISSLIDLLSAQKKGSYVCDVGNNEFWVSRAYEYVRPQADVFYSKAFGALGQSIGKAIGIYYATQEPVIVMIGDQGFQYGMQDMQYIKQWKLPVSIVVINNNCSGMIRDQEDKMQMVKYIHVTEETEYQSMEIKKASEFFGFGYHRIEEKFSFKEINGPELIELVVDRDVSLTPFLPMNRQCCDMEPALSRKLFDYLYEL